MRLKWLSRSLALPLLACSLGTARADVASPDAIKLINAVKNSDRAAVRALVQEHVNVNASEPDGTTPLHWAVHADDVETANVLIGAGADVKAANRYGVTPLPLACLNGNAAMIELLLKSGADPNGAMAEGETALMTAARTGKLDAVDVLLAHGANVNAKESWRGQTALMWAAAEGHAAVAESLAKHGADLSARSSAGFTAMAFAAREGKIDVVKALLRAGVDVNETTKGFGMTVNKGVAGQARIPGYILGFKPQGPTSALGLAVGSAHFELASFLLDSGADANSATQGWTALHEVTWVRRSGQGDNNPTPEGSGNMDSLQFVRKLVAHGANVNAQMTQHAASMGYVEFNDIGATPFLLAARTADVDLMRLLLEFGADPLLPTAENMTPLMAAAGVGSKYPGEDPGTDSEALEAVKMIWELGGDVNTVCTKGDTAMHGAAYKFLPSVVRFLAEKGAKIEIYNQKNNIGWTPLMIAEGVQRGNHIRRSDETAAVIREVMNGATGGNIQQPR